MPQALRLSVSVCVPGVECSKYYLSIRDTLSLLAYFVCMRMPLFL